MSGAGRSCPLRYRYGPAAIANAHAEALDTLYVVGGLYGNPFALRAVDALLAKETGSPRVCFNGDFNWFNVGDEDFRQINNTVLAHDATLGNVEAELFGPDDETGCGCAYPDTVSDEVVARSNRIHARLRRTAQGHPDVLRQLETLPMVRRYRVGSLTVGVVHGDAQSLAGWDFDAGRLGDPSMHGAFTEVFDAAGVQVFASSHTCLPACARIGPGRIIINNGAAGMPNFKGELHGVVTRISTRPSPWPNLYGVVENTIHIDAIALRYDSSAWNAHFLAHWPPGSDAHGSYYERMTCGPEHTLAQARP